MGDLSPARDPGMTTVRLGVDVGKLTDYTALCATEEERRDGEAHYVMRHVERLPLGTSYPEIVARVVEMMANLERLSWPRRGPRLFAIELIVDATGVGLPVVDMMKEKGLSPTPAIFTGSDAVTGAPSGTLHVGKGWLVSRLAVLLQSGRLHLPMTVEAGRLVKELEDFEIAISDAGRTSFNARAGQHDDLVIAAALSCGVQRSAGRATSRRYTDAWDLDLARDNRDVERRARLPRR